MAEPPFDIGRYHVVEQIGIGGMGRVYRATTDEGVEVAIKTMHPHLSEQEEFVRRFMLEAERLQRVSHPGVVRVYEYGKAEVGGAEVPYIVMEFVRGRKLSDVLGDIDTGTGEFTLDVPAVDGKVVVPQDGVVRILRQMAYILQACNQVDVVHRDIKPDNIIITDPSWSVKLIDFGIAKDTAEQHTLSQTGQVLGTPAYMSPEQCKGAKEIDIRTDIYALGVVAYRCLTGRLPFEAETVAGYIKKHLEEPPTPIQQLNPNVDENLALIVERMMAKEPENRHQSPDELIEDLMRCERGEPPVRVYDWETRTTYETKTEMEAARRLARRRAKIRAALRFLILAVGVAVAAIVLAFVIAPHFVKPNTTPQRLDLAKPFLEKGNSLVKSLPEAAAFWYEKARQKADTPTIRQMLADALKAADAAPLLLVRSDSKNRELLSHLVHRYWAPITVANPKNLPEGVNWGDKGRVASVLRGECGIRYVLHCTLAETPKGWRATLSRLDLRTGAEISYFGVQKTPERAVEDAFLASTVDEKRRKIHWLLVEAKSCPSRDRAIQLYRQVLALDKTVREAKEALRRLYIKVLQKYIKEGRFGEALSTAEEALAVLPNEEEVQRLKEEAEKMQRGVWLKKELAEASEALRRRDWATAVKKANAVLKQKDDEQAKRIKEAASVFRAISDALTSANLNTARQNINNAKKLRSLAPEVYDSLLNKLKEAEKRYNDLLQQIKEALKERRPEDVKGLVEQVKSVNQDDTTADELLMKAEDALSRYNTFLMEARKALKAHRYKGALVWLDKAAKLRKSGPHLEIKQKVEEALKAREQLEKRVEMAFAEGNWEELARLASELSRLYPQDACPERVKRLAAYADAISRAEKSLKKGDLKAAWDALKAAKKYKIGSEKEDEIERKLRLRVLVEGDVRQRVVDVGGDVVCIGGALDKPLLLAGLADGRFAVVSADGSKRLVFDPPKAGVKPVAAAFVKANTLLLWSDGSLQIRKDDGSLIASKSLPAPHWAYSLGDAVVMWDGAKLRLLGEKERQVEMSGVGLLGAGVLLALRGAGGKVALLDRHTLGVRSELSVKGEVVSCATSERMVALGLKDGTIELRRLNGEVVRRIKPLRWFATVLLFDRTGAFLFALDKYRTAVLIRLDTGRVLWRKRLDCWAPADAAIVGFNDALAIRGEAGKLILILPSLKP